MSDAGRENQYQTREQRARRALALRTKQLSAILTTTGYALVAGEGWEPLLKGHKIDLVHALALCFGVAMLAASVYLAPKTEV